MQLKDSFGELYYMAMFLLVTIWKVDMTIGISLNSCDHIDIPSNYTSVRQFWKAQSCQYLDMLLSGKWMTICIGHNSSDGVATLSYYASKSQFWRAPL